MQAKISLHIYFTNTCNLYIFLEHIFYQKNIILKDLFPVKDVKNSKLNESYIFKSLQLNVFPRNWYVTLT